MNTLIAVMFGVLLLGFVALAFGVFYETRRFERWCKEGRISLRDAARFYEVGGIMGGFTFCDRIGPPGTYPRG
jgi:hypothetical protein